MSELLVHRAVKKDDRRIKVGIREAIRIVGDVTDEALLGLTMVYAIKSFMSTSSNFCDALDTLDEFYGKLLYAELPRNENWIEELDLLNAIRIRGDYKFKSLKDFYSINLDGIVVVGIKKDSEDYHKAISILKENELNIPNLLVENSLLPGFFRINIENQNALNSRSIINSFISVKISEEQKKAIQSVFELYSKNIEMLEKVKENFMLELNKRSHISLVKDWFENISLFFKITPLGNVLAYTNAKRCCGDLLPMREE